MKKFFTNLAIIIAVYTIGLGVRIVFLVFKQVGRIKIVNPGNFPELKPGMLIVSNHPDLFDCMYEVFLIPALFFPQFYLHPLKLAPWFTLDERNFGNWYWAWLKPRAIPIRRCVEAGGVREVRKMFDVLHNGVIIHFPEGGRTCTGKNFQLSNGGKKIRTLKSSVGWLALKTQATVVTIWVENGEVMHQPGKKLFSWPNFKRGQIVVKFGQPIELNERLMAMSSFELTNVITESLLYLADKE